MAAPKKKEEVQEVDENGEVKSRKKSVLGFDEIQNLLNKKEGKKVARNINDMGNIPYWIPTGSKYLDYTIRQGGIGGIPGGRISSICARPGAGKSFLALSIAKEAQKMGLSVAFFDAEGGIEADFVNALGVDTNNFHHILIHSVEQMFSMIDTLTSSTKNRWLYIWDSLAATPTETEIEAGYDPSSVMASGARTLSFNLKKMMVPLIESESTFLILNQIRDNITSDRWEKIKNPFKVPGSWALLHSCSLILWLFPSEAKDNAISDLDIKIGNLIKVKIKKSRFRTTDREVPLILVWSGNKPKVMDEETWLEAVSSHPNVSTGAWNTIKLSDGLEKKIREKDFPELCKNDSSFRNNILQYMKECLIDKWNPEEVKEDSDDLIAMITPNEI